MNFVFVLKRIQKLILPIIFAIISAIILLSFSARDFFVGLVVVTLNHLHIRYFCNKMGFGEVGFFFLFSLLYVYNLVAELVSPVTVLLNEIHKMYKMFLKVTIEIMKKKIHSLFVLEESL